MTLGPLNTVGPAPSTLPTRPAEEASRPGSGFGDVVRHVLDSAASQQASADAGVRALAVGQTDQVHNVLLEVAKADLAFRLLLEVRNRLTEAYQDVTRMQF